LFLLGTFAKQKIRRQHTESRLNVVSETSADHEI
jgi:hypothetical protein